MCCRLYRGEYVSGLVTGRQSKATLRTICPIDNNIQLVRGGENGPQVVRPAHVCKVRTSQTALRALKLFGLSFASVALDQLILHPTHTLGSRFGSTANTTLGLRGVNPVWCSNFSGTVGEQRKEDK